MALERYRQKRDFEATPEPRGHVARRKQKGLAFVIQKHAASHLHYDFRLELNGVLLSWAVPKGPSLDPADKRLAMHVEDHPLEYGGFEGTIPAKQYGGGTVLLWDRGTWMPKGDAAAGYAAGQLKFELDGEKLHGGWTLVRTHGSKYGGSDGKQAWLLIKENDDYARRGVDAHVVDDAPNSVVSGRTIQEIADDRDHVWNSNRSVAVNVKAGAVAPSGIKAKSPDALKSLSQIPGVKKSRLPAALSPELATLVDAVPEGDDWLHEIKYDGYRMLCRVDGGKVRIYSRNGKDWSAMLQTVITAVARLDIKSAWLDGEVTVLRPDGRTDFQQLQNALGNPDAAALTYFLFDVPFLDGHDLRGASLLERKRVLRTIVPDGDPVVRYGVEIQGSGSQFFAQACALGLEGAVSKRISSTYKDGVRNRDWIKIKCGQRQEMVIGGYTDPQGGRKGFGALLLGVYDKDGALRYSGRVGTGFDDRTLKSLHKMLVALKQDNAPFSNPPRGYEAKGVHWVTPKLVGEVSFTEWTTEGTLRHPSFQGLREDKQATEVIRERPMETTPPDDKPAGKLPPAGKTRAAKMSAGAVASSARRKTGTTKEDEQAVFADVTLSHPDKVMYPEANLTKRDLAQYYATIGDWIVPHLLGRPLSLVRCPDGWKNQCFYQKHADKSVNAAVDRVEVPEGKGTSTYMAAASITAVVALLQWGVLEFHPWGSRTPRLDRPDRLIFDFDPDDAVAWPQVVEAVKVMRTLLDDIGLKGFLKTTGGKGLHIVVPIRPTLDWSQVKGFTKAIADLLVSTFPDRFTSTLSKALRKDKIFIDYLRNAEGATAVAPYSLRARSGAPVATPIAWDEMAADVRFAYFNAGNVPARLASMKNDPWAQFFDTQQAISKPMLKRVGVGFG